MRRTVNCYLDVIPDSDLTSEELEQEIERLKKESEEMDDWEHLL